MTEKELKSERQQAVLLAVRKLYEASNREMAHWIWENHVQWVADKSAELAKKYGANIDQSYAAALLHDLGDVWLERDEEDFDHKAESETKLILAQAGFGSDEVKYIINDIVAPHSCHEGDPLPANLEAKVLATADGLAHLLTDFYRQMKEMGLPTADREQFKSWALSKIERDYGRKLFFEEEKEMAANNYQELKGYFLNEF